MCNARHPLFLAGVFLACVTGVAATVCPFTWDVSPLDAVTPAPGLDELWQLGAPFFLAIAVGVGSLCWVVRRRFTLAERILWFGLGATSALVTFRLILDILSHRSGSTTGQETLGCLVSIAMLAAGGWLVVSSWQRSGPASFAPVAAMQVAYAGNAAFCLIEFYGGLAGWQVGAYLALVTCVVYFLQVVLTAACASPVGDTRPTDRERPPAI